MRSPSSMFLLMNRLMVDRLMLLAALLRDHEVPRVGWPTSVLSPRGVRIEVIECVGALTVTASALRGKATIRLDLSTRELVVSATGSTERRRSELRRVVLDLIADRNAFDRLSGIETRLPLPEFDEHDDKTWTEMQLLAAVCDADWCPPEPDDRSSAGWAEFYATAHRFNDRFATPADESITPRPIRPRAGRSSADRAMHDPSESAGA